MTESQLEEPAIAGEPPRRRVTLMRAWTLLFLLLGFGLLAGLIAFEDASAIGRAIVSVGWGIAAVTGVHLVPIILDALGMRALAPTGHGVGVHKFIGIQWIGESVNTLLPVAQIGGEFIKTRLLVVGGIPAIEAGAIIIVNLTVGVFAQGLFAIVGLIILILQYGEHDGVAANAAIGAGIILGGVALFYLTQRIGLFGLLARLIKAMSRGKEWLSLIGGVQGLDSAVMTVYRRRGAVGRSMLYQSVSWIIGTAEVWIVLQFMGRDVDLLDAMMLEALGQAVRSAAFLVPASLGVQEGGYVLLGTVIGLPPEQAIALSLIKRVRELALGVPGLIAWQVVEGRRWLLFRR